MTENRKHIYNIGIMYSCNCGESKIWTNSVRNESALLEHFEGNTDHYYQGFCNDKFCGICYMPLIPLKNGYILPGDNQPYDRYGCITQQHNDKVLIDGWKEDREGETLGIQKWYQANKNKLESFVAMNREAMSNKIKAAQEMQGQLNEEWFEDEKWVEPIEEAFEYIHTKEEIIQALNNNNLNWEEIIFADGTSIIIYNADGGESFVIDSYEYPEWVQEAQEWLDSQSDDYIDRLVNKDFNKEFWENADGGVLYHGTSYENLESIKQNGLGVSDKTRGISNRSVGSAVFASDSLEVAQNVYEVVLEIDIGGMKQDGYMPKVIQEPDVESYENRMAVAHRLGLDDYYYEIEQGMDPGTVIFYGNIPAKYLSVVGENNELV